MKLLPLLLASLVATVAYGQSDDWFVSNEADRCFPIRRIDALSKIRELAIDASKVNSPESLAQELKAKGVNSKLSFVEPSKRRVIEINAPRGTFWLVLAQSKHCKSFGEGPSGT